MNAEFGLVAAASSSRHGNSIVLYRHVPGEAVASAVLLDAGCSWSRFQRCLHAAEQRLGFTIDVDAILVTHFHSDHWKSLNVLAKNLAPGVIAFPDFFQSSKNTPSGDEEAQSSRTAKAVETAFSQGCDIAPLRSNACTLLNQAVKVSVHEVPHDTLCFAITVDWEGHTFGYVVDTGDWDEEFAEFLANLDVLMIEMNYDYATLYSEDTPYPASLKERIAGGYGHLSNQKTADLLDYLETRNQGPGGVLILHMSETTNSVRLIERSLLRVLPLHISRAVVPGNGMMLYQFVYATNSKPRHRKGLVGINKASVDNT